MSYPVIAKVSLKNLSDNASKVKSLVSPKVKVYAVVKANAYGHGLIGVSNALYSQVDGFCVSLTKEALDLRISGCDKDVLLLTAVDERYLDVLIRKKITLTVASKRDMLIIDRVCSELKTPACVHVKLNTGMNRLGASSVYEVNEIMSVAMRGNVKITGVYSHLGDVQNKRYLNSQRENFLRLSEPLKNCYDDCIAHLSSSGGMLKGEQYHFDMIRPGITLYGYTPFETSDVFFNPVMKVYAKTLCVRENINKEHLLYGSKKYKFDGVTLLRVGYADGFFRGEDKILPPRCMDISAVTGAHFNDYYCVMDNALSLAKKYKTIPYEILTQVTKRAEIIYV